MDTRQNLLFGYEVVAKTPNEEVPVPLNFNGNHAEVDQDTFLAFLQRSEDEARLRRIAREEVEAALKGSTLYYKETP